MGVCMISNSTAIAEVFSRSTTSSTLCTLSVLSSTGTSEKVWKRESSPRLVRTLLLSRRTTKKSEPNPKKEEREKVKALRSSKCSEHIFMHMFQKPFNFDHGPKYLK